MTHNHSHTASTLGGNIIAFGSILLFAMIESSLEIIVGYGHGNNVSNLAGGFHTLSDMFLELSAFGTFLLAWFFPQLNKDVRVEFSFVMVGIILFTVGAGLVISKVWIGTFEQGDPVRATLIGYASIFFNAGKNFILVRFVEEGGIFDTFSAHFKGDAAAGFAIGTGGAVRWIFGADGTVPIITWDVTTTQIDFALSTSIGVYLLYLAITLAYKYRNGVEQHKHTH